MASRRLDHAKRVRMASQAEGKLAKTQLNEQRKAAGLERRAGGAPRPAAIALRAATACIQAATACIGCGPLYPGGEDGLHGEDLTLTNPNPNRGDHAQVCRLLVATAALHVVRLRGAPRRRARLRVS